MAKSTKQLARELGSLRKRSYSSREGKETVGLKTKQLFAYLVVLDFESTCWKDGGHRTQEIIEFPAILLDTTTGKIESEFQFFVQPQENPTLSDFCKELTGITQDQVDEGIPLGIVLKKFSSWLRKNSSEYQFTYNSSDKNGGKCCTFVTWSDWDFGVCLHYESRRKQLRVPPELGAWIDLRATYRKFYERTPKGLNGALQDVGFDFQGREHSGLDDTKNTARLAFKMIRDGCVMKITKMLNGQQPGRGNNGSNVMKSVNHPSSMTHPMSVPAAAAKSTCKDVSSMESAQCTSNQNPTSTASNPRSNCQGHMSTGILAHLKNGTPSYNISRQRQFAASRKNPLQSRNTINSSSVESSKLPRSPPPKKNRIEPGKKFMIHVDSECANGNTVPKRSLTVLQDKTNSMTKPAVPASIVKVQPQAGNLKTPAVHQKAQSFANKLQSINQQSSATSCKGSFKTPQNFLRQAEQISSMKATPPMCTCGRRSKRKYVQSVGPNQGRSFFCCSVDRNQRKAHKGCSFFKWEPENQNLGTSPMLTAGSYFAKPNTIGLPSKSKASLPQPDFNTPQITKIVRLGLKQ